jgi:hypothetical protein
MSHNNEIARIDKELMRVVTQDNEITPEMIARARDTPVTTLVNFTRGRARCINVDHADNNPSMFYGSRTNTVQCPACGFSADAIKICQILSGATFHDAVRRLQ